MPIDYNCDFDCNCGRTIHVVWYHYPDSEKPTGNYMEWGNEDDYHDEP